MTSKVIVFPKSPPPGGPAALQDVAAALVANFSAVSAAKLLEGIDDLARAVDKVAILVAAMPTGEARLKAEANLETIRNQLVIARTLSEQVSEQHPAER
jgi:hypothetical protein